MIINKLPFFQNSLFSLLSENDEFLQIHLSKFNWFSLFHWLPPLNDGINKIAPSTLIVSQRRFFLSRAQREISH